MNGKNFPPNINPQLFSLSAVIVGAALVDDFSTEELNSIAQWIVLVGHYMVTTAAHKRLVESRINNKNINTNYSNNSQKADIDYLILAVHRIYEELEKIKKEN